MEAIVKITFLLVLYFLICLTSQLALAGTQLLMSNQQASDAATTTEIAIQNGKLRLEDSDSNKRDRQLMIYDSATDSMMVINHNEKSYTIIDANTMNQIQQEMAQVKKQMEEQLANLPPEQRAMVEKMMQGKMMQGKMPMMSDPQAESKPKPKAQVNSTGKSTSISGFDCEFVEVTTSGEKKREMCVTDWGNLDNDKEVAAAFKGMIGFFDRMFQSMRKIAPMMEEMPFSEIEQIGGFPVQIKEFSGEQVKAVSKLLSVKSHDYSAQDFEPPKDYRKKELMSVR